MSVFKCKMCGGTIEFEQGATVGICDSCGTKQTLPCLDSNRKTNLYDRANHFRRNNDFDKAMSIYEQILNEDNNDAEAYWSLVLCRYGIEYVEDPISHKHIPTVNRAQFTSIFADEDYKSALQYADSDQKTIYEDEAKAIDNIQNGILAISQKEEPFDVFICYKETDASGRRTQDSVLANELYHQLTQEGFKVFFSRITLEDKLGTAYEPYIFAALNSSDVMVVLGTKPEYFNAVWVKNEWSRYLALIKNGAKKILIPAYRDMDPYDLPEEFSHLQAQDMSKLGFMQDLIRGIKKIIPTDAPKAAINDTVVVNTNNAAIAPFLERVFLFLEDGKWQDADIYCEKVLDIDPKNAEAYLGKLMAELQVSKRDMLANCSEPFDNRENYYKVIRFSDENLESEIRGYIAYINARNEKAKADYNRKIDSIAHAIIQHCNSQSCDERVKKLSDEISYLEKKIIEFPLLENSISATQEEIQVLVEKKTVLESDKANLGLFRLREKKQIDEEIVSIEDKLNKLQVKVSDLVRDLNYYKSVDNIENMLTKKRDELADLLAESSKYSDVSMSYEEAIKEISADDQIRQKILAIYPKLPYVIANIGDTVLFGSYKQDNYISNGKEGIEWLVLAKEDNKILVISKKALDCQKYNTSYTYVTWESCSLRKWMNDTFLNEAFDSKHQEMIATTIVSADKNPEYGTNPGNATTDKVFLLSINEANKYFSNDEARKCAPTAYAKARGVYTNNDNKTGEEICCWWLRSLGLYQDSAATVISVGSVDYFGVSVNYSSMAVRPALWINLDY